MKCLFLSAQTTKADSLLSTTGSATTCHLRALQWSEVSSDSRRHPVPAAPHAPELSPPIQPPVALRLYELGPPAEDKPELCARLCAWHPSPEQAPAEPAGMGFSTQTLCSPPSEQEVPFSLPLNRQRHSSINSTQEGLTAVYSLNQRRKQTASS